MKPALYLLGAVGALALTSCVRTTLENRRDLYSPQPVNGPYTRMLRAGFPPKKVRTKVVTITTVVHTSSASGDFKNVVK